jgi:hypothetical protein
MATEEKEFKMISTSWMLPGVTCWILLIQKEEVNHFSY